MIRLLLVAMLVLGTTTFSHGKNANPGTPVLMPEAGAGQTMIAWALFSGAALVVRGRRKT